MSIPTINLNPAQLANIPFYECAKCKNTEFNKVLRIKSIPRVLTGAPIPLIYETPVYMCINCGELFTPGINDNNTIKGKRKDS